MKNRRFYEQYFSAYPELVTIKQFREMLGGLGEVQARKLIHAGKVKYFRIRREYLIPKSCVIDYILSTDYAIYRQKLKCSIP